MLSAFLHFSLFLLCEKLVKYLTQGRRNARLRLALLHRAVHRADVAVHDADALVGVAGVFLRPFSRLDPLDEQPQQLRRQLVDGGVLLRLLNECVRVGNFQLFQPGLLFGDLFLQRFLLTGVIARQHPVLLIGHPPQHIVLIEPLEQLGQFLSAPPHGIRMQRNKLYAHNNEQRILSNENLTDRHPILYPDVQEMIDFALDCTGLILGVLTDVSHATQ